MGRPFLAISALLLALLLACGGGEEPPSAAEQAAAPAKSAAAAAPDVDDDPASAIPLQIEGVGEIRLFLNPDDRVITPWIVKNRFWEETETHWFVKGIRPGDTVVDVGANVGYYAVIAGKLVGAEGRVFAFEPDPVGFALLKRNLELNGVTNVVAEQKAVSNAPGSIRLYLADANKGDHRIYQPRGEERPFVDVDAVTLDDYFADQPAPDFIKVDTQGAELVIFEGMAQTVKRTDAAVLVVEYSPRHLIGFGGTGVQLLDVIASFGVAMFDLGGGGPGLQPLRPTTRESLLQRFRPNGKTFTNLLLVKGRPDLVAEIEAQLPPPR